MTDALSSAIAAWRRQFSTLKRCEMALDPKLTSCALLSLSVNGRGDSLEVCVRQLAELLRLVELMTRRDVDPRAWHLLISDSDKCPLGQRRCAFCDDADGRVMVALSPKHSFGPRRALQSFPAIVRGALFEWSDGTMASPEYTHLRDMLLARASGLATTTRTRPVELSIDIDDSEKQFEDLQSLLYKFRDSAATLECFRLESLCVSSLSPRLIHLLVTCKLPVQVHGDWQALCDQETGDARVLNLTTLYGDAQWSEHAIEPLYQLVRAHASQLKTLYLWHGRRWFHDDQRRRESEMQTIGRTVFGPDSSLSLDYLEIIAPIGENDLQLMLMMTPHESTATDRNARQARHRVIDLTAFRLSTIQGATLRRLLTISGGVESLALLSPADDGLSIAQIPPLLRSCPSLRSLKVEVSCNDWESIREGTTPDASTSVASLELRIRNDARTVMVVSAIDRLLRVVGQSLESLSLQPTNARTWFSADLVAAVARRCPKLQELSVRHFDERFLSTLVELYGTMAFRPKRLALATGAASVDLVDFLLVLVTPTHPMAQVLRSLHIDASGQSEEEVDALDGFLKSVLNENATLRDVTLSADYALPQTDTERDDEIDRRSRWAIRLPPLRHRLATLSVLRRLNLPVAVLTDILTLAGRTAARYRMEYVPFLDLDDDMEE